MNYKLTKHVEEKLEEHLGHNIEVARYGERGKAICFSIECIDCNEVLISFDK